MYDFELEVFGIIFICRVAGDDALKHNSIASYTSLKIYLGQYWRKGTKMALKSEWKLEPFLH